MNHTTLDIPAHAVTTARRVAAATGATIRVEGPTPGAVGYTRIVVTPKAVAA